MTVLRSFGWLLLLCYPLNVIALDHCASRPATDESLAQVDKVCLSFYTADKQFVTIIADVAATPQARQQGLAKRVSLAADRGMLFIYPKPRIATMWMKNTFIPLDIIFVAEDRKIASIAANAQPCRANPCAGIKSPTPIKYVIEVNAGFIQMHAVSASDVVELRSYTGVSSNSLKVLSIATKSSSNTPSVPK